jgi:hypothetical protein
MPLNEGPATPCYDLLLYFPAKANVLETLWNETYCALVFDYIVMPLSVFHISSLSNKNYLFFFN